MTMPNNVTNVVIFHGDEQRIREILEAIKMEDIGPGSIDFDKVILMPASKRTTICRNTAMPHGTAGRTSTGLPSGTRMGLSTSESRRLVLSVFTRHGRRRIPSWKNWRSDIRRLGSRIDGRTRTSSETAASVNTSRAGKWRSISP